MVVDVFCLFSKLTLVASMEYPVLTVLLFAIFKISNFCLFVYTDKMSAGSVFFLDPFWNDIVICDSGSQIDIF
jgi:hypothetical protein